MIAPQTSNWKLGFLLSFGASLMWGILPIFLKLAIRELDPVTLTWFRFGLAMAILGLYLKGRGKFPRLRRWSKGTWWLIFLASTGLACNYLFYLIGLHLTSPTNAQVVIQFGPMLLALGGLAFFKERYRPVQWFGCAIFLFGFGLFFRDQLKLLVALRSQYLYGTLLVFLSAVTWAVYALIQKPLLKQVSSAQITLAIYAFSFLFFFPFANPTAILWMNPVSLAALIFCGFNTLIAYGCFAESMRVWDASRIGAVLALGPLITYVFTMFFTKLWPDVGVAEDISMVGLVGAGLLVLGSMTVALNRSR